MSGRHSRPRRRKRAVLALTLLVGIVVTASIAWTMWILRPLPSVSLDDGREQRPARSTEAINVLMLGVDRRGTAGDHGRSDTTVLLHFSQDGGPTVGVSIPRDTLVSPPQCARSGSGGDIAFNQIYSVGGMACTVEAIETISGVHIDHAIAVDFQGFAEAIDAIGGIDVTLPQAIADSESGARLPSGPQHLDGRQALALVRTRHSIGDGSDLGRIKLQQLVIRSVVDRLRALDLRDTPDLMGLVKNLRDDVTTDDGLSDPRRLVAVAAGLADSGDNRLDLLTIPGEIAAEDTNRLIIDEELAAPVWRRLRE